MVNLCRVSYLKWHRQSELGMLNNIYVNLYSVLFLSFFFVHLILPASFAALACCTDKHPKGLQHFVHDFCYGLLIVCAGRNLQNTDKIY